MGKRLIEEQSEARCTQIFEWHDQSGFLVSDSRGNARLIMCDWDSNLGNTIDQTLQDGIKPCVSNANRGALKKFKLRRMVYDDGVARQRADVFSIDLIANGKDQLRVLLFFHGAHDLTVHTG